jgi:hypothetical protein
MNGKRTTTIFGTVFAALLMLLGVFAIPTSVSAAGENLTANLETETGATTVLGGGDHFFVKFGSDAAFGIVWGTQNTPNNVYFVAIKARYLGVAQVYDNEGNLVEGNHTIKITTLYAVKLDDILEFNDSEKALSNGTLLGHRLYQNGNFTGSYNSLEHIYKKVDLNTAWTQSDVVDETVGDTRTWTFDLTATDLPYVSTGFDNYTGPTGDDTLNSLTLTFHLEATMVQVDNVSLPQWRITVARGIMGMGKMMWMTGIQSMEPKVVSGDVISYHVKWDQRIEGWDFDAANDNPTLLMEFEAIVGNYIPPALSGAMHMYGWAYMNMIQEMNEAGYARCVTNSGDDTVTEGTGMYASPRPLASPMMTFGGENTRIGRFQWVSNATVDGTQMMNAVHSQIMGGVPFYAIGLNGAMFGGFAVVGGMSFPGGGIIDHDPTFESDALVDVTGLTTDNALPIGLLGLAAVAIAVLVIAIAVLVSIDRKPGQKVQQNYEKSTSSQQVDWTKYYGKK